MKLKKKHRTAIVKILDFLEDGEFYLAGGTAVYYYLKHRKSDDLDFFTPKNLDLRIFRRLFDKFYVFHFEKDTIHSEVEGIKLSFFYYPYALLKPLRRFDIIKIASLEDIACMKLLAIIQRGSRKDFTDLYFIIKALGLTPPMLIELFRQKYEDFNPLVIYKSLTFFEDTEEEPDLKMVKDVRWQRIKKFFIQRFGKPKHN